MYIFIAITYYKELSLQDLKHFMTIEPAIDGLLFRTPMSTLALQRFITRLIALGFPKDKIMIHSNLNLLKALNLQCIHFKENDKRAFLIKQQYPELIVGMSTHNIEMVKQCHAYQLDYVFFGHIFSTSSHPGEPPRTNQEIHDVLKIDMPIYAIGGISPSTISQLPTAFDGLCAISFFMTSTVSEIYSLKRKWHSHA